MSYKTKIAARAAREVRPGQVINLGIGIPTRIPEYLAADMPVWVHSENGILGMGLRCRRGAEDRNLIDAGGSYVTLVPGASFFDSALSFALVRGGRLDVAFLGALEISCTGDLANWIIPGKYAPGIGGGMELAQKARRVIVTTTHTTREGAPKILPQCTLPLTAKSCVDTIITEMAVIDVTPDGLRLREIAAETDVTQVQARTGAPLIVPEGELPVF
ncbi:MAG: 3-oxoacid CoA-transferase subunit B [Desulfobacterales bacterium]|nr:MAG: 3-oxoacid CoA-transferase subunit B [Desulfobacterales bacterium]